MLHDSTHKAILVKWQTGPRKMLYDNLPRTLRHGTRDLLGDLFFELGLNKGVEVGVKYGGFSVILCKKNPNIELSCVDIWDIPHRYEGAKKALAPFNTTLLKKSSMEAVKEFEDGSLDFACIDANHTFNDTILDIIFWSEKVRSGGIVSVHDYANCRKYGVVQAVDVYTRCNLIHNWYVTREVIPTAIWVKP